MSENVSKLTAEQKLARLRTKAAEAEQKVQSAKKRAAQLRAQAEREEAKMRTKADVKDAAAFRSQETRQRLLMGDLMMEYARIPGSKAARQFVIRRIEEQNDSVRELCKDVWDELRAIKEPQQA